MGWRILTLIGDVGHAGQRPSSLLSSMFMAVPVQQVHQVQWMVPIDNGSMVCKSIRIRMLPGYMQGYSSSSKSIGKAHGIGLVPKVPTMDQTHKMADSHILSMHIVPRQFLLRQEELSRFIWFQPQNKAYCCPFRIGKLETLTISKLSKAEQAVAKDK